jgi:4-hydroxythreonine-4-phosphate dehydrogenase
VVSAHPAAICRRGDAIQLIVTPGDPLGIGPEVAAKALAARQRRHDVVCTVVGDASAFEEAARAYGCALDDINIVEPAGDIVEVASIEYAVERARAHDDVALVTGPINKASLADRGFGFTGHTDFLGHLCGVEPVMAFVGGSLRVALVTVHVPLREVASQLTTDKVLHTIRLAHSALVSDLGLPKPRISVCGLNPHAGDGGLLGAEEEQIIAPAVFRSQKLRGTVEGPVSAETAFRKAYRGDTDLVVAMYHDQGLVPLKLVDFGRSVNWTLGLPMIRTSVDHGTAYDIAGQGRADPSGMMAAIALAEMLAG